MISSPKKKPTHVIVHRIELQKTERDILEGAAIAQGAGALLTGLGNLLDPFSKPIAIIFAAWIASDGIESVWNYIDGKINEKDRNLAADYVLYLQAYNAATEAERLSDRDIFPDKPEPKPPMTEKEYAKKFDKDYVTNWDNFLAWLHPADAA